jgi:M6 family metalloprotease-like protein
MHLRPAPASRILRSAGVFLLALTALEAQPKASADRVRALNGQVLRLDGEIRQAPDGTTAALRSQATAAIRRRSAELRALMASDPAQALSLALSPELASELASRYPEAAASLETHGIWQGNLEYWIADYPHGAHRSVFRLKTSRGTMDVHFAGREPAGIGNGGAFAIEGVLAGDTLAAMSDGVRPMAATTTTTTASACSTTGVQNTAVLLVTFPGAPLPSAVTQQSLNGIFFGSGAGGSVDGFLRAASYGQTSAAGGVFGPYTLTGTYTSCGDVGGAVLTDAIAAATASGVNLNNYSRVFLVFPDIFGCGWAGYANVGACSISSSSGNLSASEAFLVASYMGNSSQGMDTAAHEMGHNLGLLHSGTLNAGSTPLGPLSSPGTFNDMGDYWSVMGETVAGLYPAPQKAEVLGWMSPTSNYEVVQSSGTFVLQPLENAPPGLQALKIQRGTGNNSWLWVEYRQPMGNYDSTLFTQPFSGALIHYEDSTTALGHTYLADFTPSDTTGFSPALAAGQTWTDPYSNLSISVLSATSTGLTVSVNYGTTPCAHANPTVSLSPTNPSVAAGASVNYTVSVTNNDSSGCTADSFSLSSTQPAGWSGAFSAPSLLVNPGQTAAATLAETASPAALPGTYGVTGTATNQSYTASAAANCTVVTAATLTDSTSVSGSAFSAHQTVTATATAMNGTSPAQGAAVTFTMTKANGSTVTAKATADASGRASWSYKVGQKDPSGTYSVSTKATYNSETATSAPVSFTVQ